MPVYLVSYDLRAPGRNYTPLYSQLKRLGLRALESVWLVQAEQTAPQLHDALHTYLDRNDGLLVAEIDIDADWKVSGLQTGAANWLKLRRP